VVPSVATTTPTPRVAGLTGGAAYRYKIVFVAPNGTESTASDEVPIRLGTTDNAVTLANLPPSTSPFFPWRRIYRTQANGNVFYQLVTITDQSTSYRDAANDAYLTVPFAAVGAPDVSQVTNVRGAGGGLTSGGTYQYRLTFFDSSKGQESPASQPI